MVEKIITLENVSLIEFLGVQNDNIKELAAAFPKSKIISRGNEIKIRGTGEEIIKIDQIIAALLNRYHKYGQITKRNVQNMLEEQIENINQEELNDEILIYGSKGIIVKPRTRNQKKLIEKAEKNDLVFAVGPAGTGKTYISVALAVRALKNREVKKIIITRPAVEAGESLGFLPGDMKEKIDPYIRPIYDALHDMIDSEKLKTLQENGTIEIAPLAYMRGRTLKDAFVLLDEAQNTTTMQIKMFMTRMGQKSKVIITGDLSQVDLPRHQKSGLREAVSRLKGIKGIGFAYLDSSDVIRHELVSKIIDAYEKADYPGPEE